MKITISFDVNAASFESTTVEDVLEALFVHGNLDKEISDLMACVKSGVDARHGFGKQLLDEYGQPIGHIEVTDCKPRTLADVL